jgi:immune inhibitor A
MAPLAPDVLDNLRHDLEAARAEHPNVADLLAMKTLRPRPGLNDGLIYPPSRYPSGTSSNVMRAAALEKAPLRGSINTLVVLVDFPDCPFKLPPGNANQRFRVRSC